MITEKGLDEVVSPLMGSPAKPKKQERSILVKACANGFGGLFYSAHIALNGKLVAAFAKRDGDAASSLMSTYFTVVIGCGVGLVLATGLDFGKAVGEEEYLKAGNIVKTANILAVAIGFVSTGLLLASGLILPAIFEAETAKIASEFFRGYAFAPIPTLTYGFVAVQVAFQHGDVFVSPINKLLILLTSGALSYYLGFKTSLGVFGIGLGGSIGCVIGALFVWAWTLRNDYRKYQVYTCPVDGFLLKLGSLWSLGWKLMVQRLTEWGNLMIISSIVGAQSNSALRALNPSLLYLVLISTTQQNFGHAVGMMVSKNKGAIEKIKTGSSVEEGASDEEIIREMEALHRENFKTIVLSSVFGLSINAIIAISFYFARKPLTDFLLSLDTNDKERQLARTLLWINMVGLMPDALRIIVVGALRGWGDLLYPALVCVFFMTVVGIPAAYAMSIQFGDGPQLMGHARNLTMFISVCVIIMRCYSKIKSDKTEVSNFSRNNNILFVERDAHSLNGSDEQDCSQAFKGKDH